MKHQLYECGICDCWHPVSWDGDCRDDANRFGDPQEYAELHSIDERSIELFDMDEVEEVREANK